MCWITREIKKRKSLKIYQQYYSRKRETIKGILQHYKKEDKKIAIWGAGLKGEALLLTLDSSSQYIDCVFDLDKGKHGRKTLSGQLIVNYKDEKHKDTDVILAMNSNHENEIAAFLEEEGYKATLLNLDSIIEGDLTIQEVIRFYDKKSKVSKIANSTNIIEAKDIAAVVFLYEFDENTLENIKSYTEDIGVVYAFDNSDSKNLKLIEALKKIRHVVYIDGSGNQGLSRAINITAQMAIEEKYKWFITLDQDSKAHSCMINNMKEFLQNMPQDKLQKLAIISPSIHQSNEKFAIGGGKYSYQDMVIQSGAMHNLEIYQKLNGYDEALFIDQVDFEYCVRTRLENYVIIKLNTAILIQNTDDRTARIIRRKGRKLVVDKYSIKRYYYITRNALYCAKKYKNKNIIYCETNFYTLGTLFRTVPYEARRILIFKAIVLGVLDYLLRRQGKCRWKL